MLPEQPNRLRRISLQLLSLKIYGSCRNSAGVPNPKIGFAGVEVDVQPSAAAAGERPRYNVIDQQLTGSPNCEITRTKLGVPIESQLLMRFVVTICCSYRLAFNAAFTESSANWKFGNSITKLQAVYLDCDLLRCQATTRASKFDFFKLKRPKRPFSIC